MLKENMESRQLPPTFPEGLKPENWQDFRKKTLDTFMREEYGITPPAPACVRAEKGPDEVNAWAGKAQAYPVKLSFDTPNGEFSFTANMVLPYTDKKLPLILYISFLPYPNGRYGLIEEVVDHGYAMATFCYDDVTLDKDDNFESGLAAMYPRNDPATDWGKIGMWAFAASRVLDYVLTLPQVDPNRVFVLGHSRLGKTALWAAAQDERFAAGCSNDSGCSGAATTRDKIGEDVEAIIYRFSYWFCGNYRKYVKKEHEMPFEQYQMAACIAPRVLYIASAKEDSWSDPLSEFITAAKASEAYELLGLPGLINPTGEMPEAPAALHEGNVAYHIRTGLHFMSRADWLQYMAYFDQKFPG